jgi:hypothetical protein
MDVIWGKREGKYFLEKDWTGRNRLIGLNKFAVTRRAKTWTELGSMSRFAGLSSGVRA